MWDMNQVQYAEQRYEDLQAEAEQWRLLQQFRHVQPNLWVRLMARCLSQCGQYLINIGQSVQRWSQPTQQQPMNKSNI